MHNIHAMNIIELKMMGIVSNCSYKSLSHFVLNLKSGNSDSKIQLPIEIVIKIKKLRH